MKSSLSNKVTNWIADKLHKTYVNPFINSKLFRLSLLLLQIDATKKYFQSKYFCLDDDLKTTGLELGIWLTLTLKSLASFNIDTDTTRLDFRNIRYKDVHYIMWNDTNKKCHWIGHSIGSLLHFCNRPCNRPLNQNKKSFFCVLWIGCTKQSWGYSKPKV